MLTRNEVRSPITGTTNVELVDEISAEVAISNYRTEYDIDVSDYFSGLKTIKIYKCNDTGYRFYYPFELAGRSDLYEKLQSISWYYSLRYEHQVAEKYIKPTDSVLEVGCGFGYFLEKLQKNGISCVGLEFNEEAVKNGISRALNISKQDLIEHTAINPEAYDIVCSFQVVEHVAQPYDFIKASVDALKPGGLLIIGVPNNNPYLFRKDKYHTLNLPPHHMGLWDKLSLANMGKHLNLEIEEILVEPLQDWEIEQYIKISINSSILKIILLFFTSKIRPLRVRLMFRNFFRLKFDGRNILAIYKKP